MLRLFGKLGIVGLAGGTGLPRWCLVNLLVCWYYLDFQRITSLARVVCGKSSVPKCLLVEGWGGGKDCALAKCLHTYEKGMVLLTTEQGAKRYCIENDGG